MFQRQRHEPMKNKLLYTAYSSSPATTVYTAAAVHCWRKVCGKPSILLGYQSRQLIALGCISIARAGQRDWRRALEQLRLRASLAPEKH